MDLFISNLDSHATKEQLKHLLTPVLQRFQIEVFDLRKRNDKPFAFLAIADALKAQKLLIYAAQHETLLISSSGKYARFGVSNRPTDPQLFRVLQKEEKDLKSRQAWQKMTKQDLEKKPVAEDDQSLSITTLECGRWETTTGKPIFMPYWLTDCGGSLARDSKSLLITLKTSQSQEHTLVMDLFSIQALCFCKIGNLDTVTFTLTLAPRFLETESSTPEQQLTNLLSSLGRDIMHKRSNPSYRVGGLPGTSKAMTGSCLSYRLTFPESVTGLKNAIQRLTSFRLPLTKTPDIITRPQVDPFRKQVAQLNSIILRYHCSFRWKFQIQGLWMNGLLSPNEVRLMMPAMRDLRKRAGEEALIRILKRLALQLPIPDPSTNLRSGGLEGALTTMRQQEEYLIDGDLEEEEEQASREEMSIHKVVVTPAGVYTAGPEPMAANRILRQYRAHSDCFLRVLFADESEERLEFDRGFSNERILQDRFLTILLKGLDIAGEHYDFLGFSHSSLRSQTCWFMRAFVHEGSLLFANQLIRQLGDFSSIRCPAKCAARIGQAFSETTIAVKVDPKIVRIEDDVRAGQYMFTDGCGTISREAWRMLRGSNTVKKQPTSYQIRYKGKRNCCNKALTNNILGAKGMLSLDTRLSGRQIVLRKSMVKFDGSPSNDIEICGSNVRPLDFKLNRPVIKILEDLGIPAGIFETLQEHAIEKLRQSACSTKSAIEFLSHRLVESSSGLPALLKCLRELRIDITEDVFLREILGALLQEELRQIKYRGRILVPDGKTLYGISDETGFLKMGQVFVTFSLDHSKSQSHIIGRVAVTRSPALHPGDVQTAEAITPPEGSSLWDLQNCIVFSQRGSRDLPSMLSGGDLDGDLYNVIWDEGLVPESVEVPAAYLPAQAVDIGRKVTSDDMSGFFIDFMQNDQLGRIATLHQVFADLESTRSETCLLLAELHSTAVDFSKSGVPVDIKQIPKAPRFRPDFMAPSASTKVEKGIQRPVEMELPAIDLPYRYYESDRVLGKLYRAVDEDVFFRELEDDASSMFSREAAQTTLGEILEWVETNVDTDIMEDYAETAIEARNYYENTMLDYMSRYTVHRNDPLTEKEVFTGVILGRSGKASRYQQEQSEHMKSCFNWELRDLKSWMQKQANGDEDNFVCLAAACLDHAVNHQSEVDGKLNSFGWVVAAMCVPALVG